MIPTARTAYLLALTAIAFLVVGDVIGTMAVAAVIAVYAADVWMLRVEPVVERQVAGLLQRGYPSPLHVSASAQGMSRVKIRQPSIPDLQLNNQEADSVLQTEVTPMRRGKHSLPAVVVRLEGPLRLAARHRTVGLPFDMTVYPDVLGARRIARAVATGRFQLTGRRRAGQLGLGTEFESIRDYTPDDDIRQVNWRATMRTGRPMTNVYRMDQDRDVTIVVDGGRLMAAPMGSLTRLDAAVDAATAIAHTADAIDDHCGTVAFDRTVLRRLPPRRRGAQAVVHALHDLEPTEIESDYEAAFQIVARAKRSLVVVFTDLFEESAARPLVDAVPVLTRRHAVIVASARDDDLRDAVTRPPLNVEDVYRSVVALDALAARRRVVARLRHAGATVIEASPSALPAASVAAYLELKQRAAV